MSVAVVITYRRPDTVGPTYLPVATEAVYAAHWSPAAAELGLVWLPLFQTGTTVALDDLPAVRAELARLRDHFAGAPDDAPMIAHLRERSAWLVDQLARLDPAGLADLFIG